MLMPTEVSGNAVTEPVFSLVYVSASVNLLSNDELETILTAWRKKNIRLNITGILVYYDGGFMQMLEGDEATVRSLFAVIAEDKRHRHIFKLLEEYAPNRMFPDWSMAFQRLSAENTRHIEGFTRFAEAKQFVEYYKDRPQDSVILLQSFLSRLR